MDMKTRRLTSGAMFTAIFCMMMLLNRQTGEAFAGIIYFLLPIPMVGFASRYGFKSGLTVMAAMTLLSSIMSTPLSIFYAFSECFIGLVLGSGIHAKKPTERLLLATMGLSALVELLNIAFMAIVSGFSLADEAAQMRQIMMDTWNQYGAAAGDTAAMMEQFLSPRTLIQMLVLSTVISGLFQGFLVFQLCLVILRKLKFDVPKPKSVFQFYPPQWSGFLAILCYCGFLYIQTQEKTGLVSDMIQVAGLAGNFYLVSFGFLCAVLLCKRFVTRNGWAIALIVIIGFFIMPTIMLILGFLYLNPSYHESIMLGVEETPKEPDIFVRSDDQ